MSLRRSSATHPHLPLHLPNPMFSPLQTPIRQSSTSTHSRTRDSQDPRQSHPLAWRSPPPGQIGRSTHVPRAQPTQGLEAQEDSWIYTFFTDAVEAVEIEADSNEVGQTDLDVPEHLDPADLENTPVIPPTPPDFLSGWAFDGFGYDPVRELAQLRSMGRPSNTSNDSASGTGPTRSNSTPIPRRPRRQNRIGSEEVEQSLVRETLNRSMTIPPPWTPTARAEENRDRNSSQQPDGRRDEFARTSQRLRELTSSLARRDRNVQYREMDELISRMLESTRSLRLNLSRASQAESGSSAGPSIWNESTDSSEASPGGQGETEAPDFDMDLLTMPWFGMPDPPAPSDLERTTGALFNDVDTYSQPPPLQSVLDSSDESDFDSSDNDDGSEVVGHNRVFIPPRAVSDIDELSGDDSESDESEDDEVRPTVWSELYSGGEGYYVVPGDNRDSNPSSSSSIERARLSDIRMGATNAFRRYTLPQPPAMVRTIPTRPRQVLFDPDGEFLENAREEWDDGDKDEEEEEEERRRRWRFVR
ncbi:hypothetical protein VNI00_013335 [Paramarasmius palmivorus]|uniref:Uncharacterized protein n=1 Tax=Paramarasmius palmivorus TaxID=297713 RepID=A0AAW0C128_9AGAR